jgi:hypothetical protein
LLTITLRDTDCTDGRLATLLTLFGDPTTQAVLDAALLQPIEVLRGRGLSLDLTRIQK